MDESTVWWILPSFSLNFTVDESCGKCSPCRLGTKRLLEMLEKLLPGKEPWKIWINWKNFVIT